MSHCARVNERCRRCEGTLPFAFSMAFQPIVDVEQALIVGYEALVRGPQGQSAGSILSKVDAVTLYRFDQACRIKALELASQLGMRQTLSINFLPNAVYEPSACIEATLETARRLDWPTQRVNFEIVETEYVKDRGHLRNIIDTYQSMGFSTALDDFGTGYANLELLTDLTPNTLKLDLQLVRNVHLDPRRQAMLRATASLARDLDIELIAEGVENLEEARWLTQQGIHRQQGFLYARPLLEQLPEVPSALFASINSR